MDVFFFATPYQIRAILKRNLNRHNLRNSASSLFLKCLCKQNAARPDSTEEVARKRTSPNSKILHLVLVGGYLAETFACRIWPFRVKTKDVLAPRARRQRGSWPGDHLRIGGELHKVTLSNSPPSWFVLSRAPVVAVSPPIGAEQAAAGCSCGYIVYL